MSGERAPQPVARVVILGASNVARGIATIADVARETFGSPVEILAAMGHGRSYGLTTSIPFRTLPSILDCGLWKALEALPPRPTWTLLTDIGNDLIYGCRPAQVIEWVDRCATRLRGRSERMALTGLPLESVARIGLLRFHAFRNALFPRSRLTLLEAKRYAFELHDAVQRLSVEHRAEMVEPASHWYGIDPIHIQIRAQREAWRKIFFALRGDFPTAGVETRSHWREWWRVMMIRPARSRVLLRDRTVAQPAVMLRDGSTISFF